MRDALLRYAFLGALLVIVLAGCATPAPTAVPTAPPTRVSPTSAPAVMETSSGTETPAVPPTPNPTISASDLPHLTVRTYDGGKLQTTKVLTATSAFTTSLVTYRSEGLRISGTLTIPRGQGPFPAVVLVHGYVPPEQFYPGIDTRSAAEALAQHGYIAFEPDLRGYETSEHGLNIFLAGFTADVLNAGASLKQLPNVDPKRVAVWGHSMGAGVVERAIIVSDMFQAAVLYAPLSGNMDDMFMDPFGGEPVGVTQDLINAVLAGIPDENFSKPFSPQNYWAQVKAPVSIHVGSADQTTPPPWAQAIRDGLQKQGKTVEYFEYPGQGHTFTGDAVSQFNDRVINFLDKNLK